MPKNAPPATDANELQKRLDTVNSKLRTSELLLSVSQKIAGLKNLSEILWTIIETTTETLTQTGAACF